MHQMFRFFAMSKAKGVTVSEERRSGNEPPRLCRRTQLVRSRVYEKQNDEQIFSWVRAHAVGW